MGKKSTENRRIVLDMLMELHNDPKAKEHVLLGNVLNKYDYFERMDKAFITYLFEGVIRNRIKLDYVIDQFAKTKNGKMKPVVRNILRMTTFQILYMDSVPGSAACNEAVNLMVDRGLSMLKGFVNGVSRNIERNKDSITWPSKDKDYNKYLSVTYSMPQWISDYIVLHYGKDVAERMLDRMARPSDVTIRITSESSKDAVIKQLEDNGNNPERHPYHEWAYRISKIDGIENLPGFSDGLFTVQDVSSQLAVHVADIKKGMKVLDLCSAPGGKTMYAALKAGVEGHVDARDLAEYKLDSIEENAKRLKLNNVSVSQWNACEYDESLADSYDIVIVDAPCSGLGVMGKKSDIRYNISLKQIDELAGIQRKILANAVRYLKRGGRLMYLTCTITKEENLDNRKWLLDNYPLEAWSIEEMLPDELKNIGGASGYIQLLPGLHDCDGFFISEYIKN